MRISHIVAMADNRVIGANGNLPWRISEDFKFFKSTTMGHPIVMGRKTFDSIGKALPGRPNIVITRSAGLQIPGVMVVDSLAAALSLCESRQKEWGEEVFMVGGGEIYRQSLARTNKIYLTQVHTIVDGDTYYPETPEGEFTKTAVGTFSEPLSYERFVFERR